MTITQALSLDQGAKFSILALLFCFAAWGGAWAGEAPPSSAGRIWLVAERRAVTPEHLMEVMLEAGAVELGETHDNPAHHALQAWVARRLAAAGRRPALVLEMADQDQQPILDGAGEDLTGLGEALAWEKRGWPAWALYRPIVQAVRDAGGRLIAGNLPSARIRGMVRGDDKGEEAFPVSSAERAAMTEEIRAAHCGLLPDAALPGMVRVQRARDTALAEAMAAAAARPEQGPVLLVAGSGHVRRDRGAPALLARLAPNLRQFVLAFREGDDDGAGDGGDLPYDAVWYTAPAPREDPCDQLARRVKSSR